jgi:hypothetical protein
MLTNGHYDILDKRKHLKLLLDEPNAVAFDYQPGDGTRYVVRFSLMSPNERRAYGCSVDAMLMTHNTGPNTFAGMTVENGTHPNYIMEKMGCNAVTAKVYETLIDFVFNGTDVGPSLYETEAAR